MSRVITIASGKGGTGKTTITANLVVALVQVGREVIILYADIVMANLELVLGMEGKELTLHDVLKGYASIRDVIYEGPGGVRVIPAGINLETLKGVDPEKLKDVLSELFYSAEILLIDAPAGLGKDALSAISAGEELLLVVNPDISSLSDALKTKIIGEKLGCKVLGAVLNRAEFSNSEITVDEISVILDLPILATIPEDKNVKISTVYGEPLLLKYPDSPASIAIKKLAATLVGEVFAEEIKEEKGLKKLIKGLLGMS